MMSANYPARYRRGMPTALQKALPIQTMALSPQCPLRGNKVYCLGNEISPSPSLSNKKAESIPYTVSSLLLEGHTKKDTKKFSIETELP